MSQTSQPQEEEEEKQVTYKCSLCPCVFCTGADLHSHLSTFGYNTEQHLTAFEKTHKQLEYGYSNIGDDYS